MAPEMAQVETPSIAVIGDGQMGLFCAALLGQGQRARSVTLWGHEGPAVEELAQSRVSGRLAGLRVPERVRVTPDLRVALSGAEVVISAVPTQFIRSVWSRAEVRAGLSAGAAVVSVSKGLEDGRLLRPTQVLAEALSDDPDRAGRSYAVLSGPTIAAELARCLPATMIAASDDAGLAARVQGLFTTQWLRIYTGEDPLGVELAGATKNVIAIAAGILDGLQAGFNAKSALLARGLAEIARLGTAMGAKAETFFGLAGAGDLATTCFSPEGRNRSLGEALGRGERLEAYLARTRSVVEGVATTRAVVELSGKYRVEMPIASAVHAVLYEGLDPLEAIARLMSRLPKAERVG
ncbi:MAG: NAD(P)H-dependent glycerol-3-phosphate dehydrogenase [Planctomycetota bacterium]|nr:NAD(P)H-dependent glycerol-3-phosphate dehydrogenase [Planctomycetota bacterium]